MLWICFAPWLLRISWEHWYFREGASWIVLRVKGRVCLPRTGTLFTILLKFCFKKRICSKNYIYIYIYKIYIKGWNLSVYTAELTVFIRPTFSFISPSINSRYDPSSAIVHGSSWHLTSPWCRLLLRALQSYVTEGNFYCKKPDVADWKRPVVVENRTMNESCSIISDKHKSI